MKLNEQRYKCIQNLENALMNAADELMSCTLAYDGDDDFRALTDELASEHDFDKAYIPLLADMLREHSLVNDVMVFDDEIIVSVNRQEKEQADGSEFGMISNRRLSKMKTKISMNTPEALEAYDVEITAVAVLSHDEYQALLVNSTLPERYLDRLKYTDAVTETPTSCLIKSYKAMLVLDENGEHGLAVCGGDGGVYRSGLFPNAREWLDRRIQKAVDFAIDYRGNVSGRRWDIPYKMFGEYCDLSITADNGIGELLLQKLRGRSEIADIIMSEGGFKINYYLDNVQDSISISQRFVTLLGLIGANLNDVHICHCDEEHDVSTIVELNNNTLTEQGNTEPFRP